MVLCQDIECNTSNNKVLFVNVNGVDLDMQGERMNLVACGWRHTIAVSDSGALFTFGWSKYGQLGHGNFQDHVVPHQVEALKNNKIQVVRCLHSLLACPYREILSRPLIY